MQSKGFYDPLWEWAMVALLLEKTLFTPWENWFFGTEVWKTRPLARSLAPWQNGHAPWGKRYCTLRNLGKRCCSGASLVWYESSKPLREKSRSDRNCFVKTIWNTFNPNGLFDTTLSWKGCSSLRNITSKNISLKEGHFLCREISRAPIALRMACRKSIYSTQNQNRIHVSYPSPRQILFRNTKIMFRWAPLVRSFHNSALRKRSGGPFSF